MEGNPWVQLTAPKKKKKRNLKKEESLNILLLEGHYPQPDKEYLPSTHR
jgi:hypothetical protein